ncbi:MAG: rhodanese-like domain-containing protein [Chitinophagaceae bacterium]
MGLLSLLGLGNGPVKEALRKGAVIIDVRTAAEFDQGHIREAINIPVDRINANAERIRSMNRPVIVCCDSGTRSSIAKQYLFANGMKDNVYNGGSWERVLKIIRSL